MLLSVTCFSVYRLILDCLQVRMGKREWVAEGLGDRNPQSGSGQSPGGDPWCLESAYDWLLGVRNRCV